MKNVNSWPKWAPSDITEWLEKTDANHHRIMHDLYVVLVTDERMKPVWEWHETIRTKLPRYLGGSAFSFGQKIMSAMTMPRKPGNLPPKERATFMKAVRKHAGELSGLLQGTQFDGGGPRVLIDTEKLEEDILNYLQPYGDDEEGHEVCFHVSWDGVRKMDYFYPFSTLTDQLQEVIRWTSLDDYTGGSTASSAPISKARTESSRLVYFTCTFYTSIRRVSIPFNLLATIANVALNLDKDKQTDEETVRKQVRRFEARMKQRDE